MPAAFTIAPTRHVLPLCVAMSALAGFLLGYLGVFSATFDFFAQFTAHWLVIAVMAVIASFNPRRAYAILAAGPVLAGLLPVALAGWYAGDLTALIEPRAAQAVTPAAVSSRRGRFKLVTFNVYHHNSDLDGIWQEVRRHDGDIVVMLELGPRKAALRRRLAKRYPYYRTCEANPDCAIGLFSRLPAHRFTIVEPRRGDGPALISAVIDAGGERVTLFATHILSPNHGPHANFMELDHLAERVRHAEGPIVVAGDLNTTLWAHAFDNFRRKSGLVHMGHLVPTWPVQPLALPQIGIDHIFASGDLRISGVAAGRAAGSDHLPVVATLALR